MGHKPKTMSEIYSHLFEEVGLRLAEADAVGFGFDLPKNSLLHRLHRKLEMKCSKKWL
jgi:hypothetical protein